MTTQDMLRSIDDDAYALKVALIAAFDKQFGTGLAKRGIDNLSFASILETVSALPYTKVYPLLKRTVGHGLDENQKDFLYQYLDSAFENTPGKDFDSFEFQSFCQNPQLKNIAFIIDDNQGRSFVKISSKPLMIVEFVREMTLNFEPIEAIFVRNGKVLIMSTIPMLETIPLYQKLMDLQQ